MQEESFPVSNTSEDELLRGLLRPRRHFLDFHVARAAAVSYVRSPLTVTTMAMARPGSDVTRYRALPSSRLDAGITLLILTTA